MIWARQAAHSSTLWTEAAEWRQSTALDSPLSLSLSLSLSPKGEGQSAGETAQSEEVAPKCKSESKSKPKLKLKLRRRPGRQMQPHGPHTKGPLWLKGEIGARISGWASRGSSSWASSARAHSSGLLACRRRPLGRKRRASAREGAPAPRGTVCGPPQTVCGSLGPAIELQAASGRPMGPHWAP